MRGGKCQTFHRTWDDVLCGHICVIHWVPETMKNRLWGLILCCQFGWDTMCPDIWLHGLRVFISIFLYEVDIWTSGQVKHIPSHCGLHPINGMSYYGCPKQNKRQSEELILSACSNWDIHPFCIHTRTTPLASHCLQLVDKRLWEVSISITKWTSSLL